MKELIAFEALLGEILLVDDLPMRTPTEEYRIERLRQNFRLDLPSWRTSAGFAYPPDYPLQRGPHVHPHRELTLIATLIAPLLASPPKGALELWARFDIAAKQLGGPCDYAAASNRCNVDESSKGSHFVKYVPFQSFSRYIPHAKVAPKAKWGEQLKTEQGLEEFRLRLRDFLQEARSDDMLIGVGPSPKAGCVPNPMFIVRGDDAPHRRLPGNITAGSNEAARFVISSMGLPGYETPADRRRAGGLLAITIPLYCIDVAYRPTILEAIREGGYFFLPAPTTGLRGKTWPLVKALDRNDPEAEDGVPEWISHSCCEFQKKESIVEVVGVFNEP